MAASVLTCSKETLVATLRDCGKQERERARKSERTVGRDSSAVRVCESGVRESYNGVCVCVCVLQLDRGNRLTRFAVYYFNNVLQHGTSLHASALKASLNKVKLCCASVDITILGDALGVPSGGMGA